MGCALPTEEAPCLDGFVRGDDGGCRPEAAAPPAPSGDTGAADAPRDVVVIVLDTGRLALFDDATMPRLMSRVPAGVFVENMMGVAGWTRPATAALMTGVRADEEGLNPDGAKVVGPDHLPVSWAFGQAGYATLLASANPALDLKGFVAPFEDVDFVDPSSGLESQAAGVLDFLADERRPAFVWVQAMELHVPYNQLDDSCAADVQAANVGCPVQVSASPGGDLAFAGDAFDGLTDAELAQCRVAIEAAQRCTATRLDHELDTFLTQLGDDPLVVVVTDHGEGWLDPEPDHNWGTNQKLTRDFFLMLHSSLPAQTLPEATQVDLAPTLLREAGLPYADLGLEGVPLGEAPTHPATAWYCDGFGHPEVAAWADGLQAIRLEDHNGAPQYSLFDTVADPAGDVNLLPPGDPSGIPPALLAEVDAKMVRTGWLCPE